MLNTAQWATTARILILVVGAFAVGRGWATQEQVNAVASNAEVLGVVGGGIAIIVSGFYALRSRTTKALIKTTAALPSVARIEAAPHLADAIPSDKVVPAASGSAEATA